MNISRRKRNPTIEVILLFQVAKQSRSCWSKSNVIGTLNRLKKVSFKTQNLSGAPIKLLNFINTPERFCALNAFNYMA